MTQRDQVIEVMKRNGGYATLGQLYAAVDTAGWKTQTPQESIRRIVQETTYFFKIEPGLWALNSWADKLPAHLKPQPETDRQTSVHYYYQGLLLELGERKGYATFVPQQDKRRLFLDKELQDLRSLSEIPDFGYPEFMRQARTVDVSWFNDRKMPTHLFEVEHSTDMDRSLIKFNELTDFNTAFYIVADAGRRRQFKDKLSQHTFKDIEGRVKFIEYETLTHEHAKAMASPQL